MVTRQRSLLAADRLAPVVFIFLAATLVASTAVSDAEEFRAAATRVDITPPAELEMWGYSNRTTGATGMHDPLHACILVFDDGPTRLALVTLDLGRTFVPASMATVRRRVRAAARVQEVFFLASHTHSAPAVDGPGEATSRWEAVALDRIVAGIKKATGSLRPARIGSGSGEIRIGHNRRLVLPDGSVKMLWRNATRIPTSPVDPHVGVIRVDDAGGTPIAVLVNYSCHPVVLGPDNLRYSADFPGAMARVVEADLGGTPICFFLQGGPGDINPYLDKTPIEEGGLRAMVETGEELGRKAAEISRAVVTRSPAVPALKFTLDTMSFESRWNSEQVLASLKDRLGPDRLERYRRYFAEALDCPVMTLLITDEIALMGMPGEPFVDFSIDFRARSPVKSSFFVGYANGYFGYFPTIRAAVVGGYGADGIVTRARVGAGEAMVDHSIVTLYTMLGMLKPLPR